MPGSGSELVAAVMAGQDFVLAEVDPDGTPGFSGDKAAAATLTAETAAELSDLQQRLYANGVDGSGRSLLLIVQGMDTAGKGGIMRHVVGEVDPQGVKIKAFKAPTDEELSHHFLWRIKRELPSPGLIGVFDRSHYEDVLNVRVNGLVPETEWSGRYDEINDFERALAAGGTGIVKVMLHISKAEQAARLSARLERPEKHWKYNPADVTERRHWDAYMDAYQAMIDHTNTEHAPWHVIPADKKWYSRLAVNQLLLKTLRTMDLQWPRATFDVGLERTRLAES